MSDQIAALRGSGGGPQASIAELTWAVSQLAASITLLQTTNYALQGGLTALLAGELREATDAFAKAADATARSSKYSDEAYNVLLELAKRLSESDGRA